ncbi:hypothetical protein MTO96_044494, partial [Rhipicephalus appendiculatus]
DLRAYFKSLGADISEEQPPASLALNLAEIINVCDVCFREASDSDIEAGAQQHRLPARGRGARRGRAPGERVLRQAGAGPFQPARRDGRARASEPLRGAQRGQPPALRRLLQPGQGGRQDGHDNDGVQRPPKGSVTARHPRFVAAVSVGLLHIVRRGIRRLKNGSIYY